MTLEDVIHEYFPKSVNVSSEECKGGVINLTYHITVEKDGLCEHYRLQRMNPMFGTSLMEDIEFITEYLFLKNIETPRVVRTLEGEMFVKDGGLWWRMLTYLSGEIFSSIVSLGQAREAGRLVGSFHTALIDCGYEFKFKLPHYHDVNFDMEKLRLTLLENKNSDKYRQLKELAENILSFHARLPPSVVLPERIIHDDLKLNNILFDVTGEKALAFIDIDTFKRGSIAIDLGDALRDWCLPGGEDAQVVRFDRDIYDMALNGYNSTATFLTEEEKNSIPYGVKLVTLELAARFVTDAFSENYFKLDSSKYKNLFEQNKKKAENQFSFFKEFSAVFGGDGGK